MGTTFLACEESGATAHHCSALLGGGAGQTGLTRAFTGRLARGIQNQLMDELNQPGVEILPYPLQRALVKNLVTLADKVGSTDLSQMWAGQSANLIRYTHATELLQVLVAEVLSVAGSVLQWSRTRRKGTRPTAGEA